MCVMFDRILIRSDKSRVLAFIGFFAQFFALNSLSVLPSTKNLVIMSKNGDKHALINVFFTLSVTANSKLSIICLQII